jgi:colanic acid/amylovoran biosynthesis glycosyltransferase
VKRPVLTIAYLANQFPAAVEGYVGEEIEELRRRGAKVIPGSVRRPGSTGSHSQNRSLAEETVCLRQIRVRTLVRAVALILTRGERISDILKRVLFRGNEGPWIRLKALLHVGLGACYAVRLENRGVHHIHIHHGYFGSFVGMIAARFLGISYSVTLHGSDLLLHSAYLDLKLGNCRFCLTISEYNRRYILEHFPGVDATKIHVSRLGVETVFCQFSESNASRQFTILAVGRLHAVKDHAFLVRACARLRDCEVPFTCLIAGEGPERRNLEVIIGRHGLQNCVALLGHVNREKMDSLYETADLVVLTSRSEGIPLVLMEAMAREKIVMAPEITGIPELILPGRNGFLYKAGEMEEFVQRILFLHALMCTKNAVSFGRLKWIRHAARLQVVNNFGRANNLTHFGDSFLQLVARQDWSHLHENFVLQQI